MATRRLGDYILRFLGIGGATADATNPLSVRGAGSLFDGNTSGHQVKINKSSSSDNASVMFQTSSSSRAEIGTQGSDDFEIKVSDNGSAFNTALSASRASGVVSFPSGVDNINKPMKLSSITGSHPGNGWSSAPLGNTFEFGGSNGYQWISNGKVRVPSDGVYQISGFAGVRNLPAQPVKYILSAKTSIGDKALTRGFVEVPSSSYWGASGLTTLNLSANDTIEFELFIANNNGNSALGVTLNYFQLDLTVVRVG